MYLIMGEPAPWGILFSWQIRGTTQPGPDKANTSQAFAYTSLVKARHMAKPKAKGVCVLVGGGGGGVYLLLSVLGGTSRYHSQGRE